MRAMRLIDVTAFAAITNLAGVLDSFQGKYSLLPDGTTVPVVSGIISAASAPVPSARGSPWGRRSRSP